MEKDINYDKQVKEKAWKLIRAISPERENPGDLLTKLDQAIERVELGHVLLRKPPLPKDIELVVYGKRGKQSHYGWYKGIMCDDEDFHADDGALVTDIIYYLHLPTILSERADHCKRTFEEK